MISGVISFSAEHLFGIYIDKFISDRRERREIKEALAVIGRFDIRFNDTDVDRGSFQDFIRKSETIEKLFFYFFGYKNQKKDRIELIHELTAEAFQWINSENKKYNRAICNHDGVIREYFTELFNKLDDYRESILKLTDKAIVAVISETMQINFNETKQLITNQNFSIDSAFINDNLESAINTLGGRYSEDLNIITENRLVFESLFITDKYCERLNEFYQDLVEQCGKRTDSIRNRSIEESIVTFKKEIDGSLNDLNELLNELSEKEIIVRVLSDMEKKIPSIECFVDISKGDAEQFNSFFYRVSEKISEFLMFIENSAYELIHSPYLLVYGEAGIGKSHLLADIAKNKVEENYDVMLFLGQHFSDSLDPWQQIMGGLSINANVDQFLGELENHAIKKNKRFCIMIDALNEGEGRGLWSDHFQRFFDKMKKYSKVSFVFSIRSNFINEILPEDFIQRNKITQKELFGFLDQEDRAINSFCKYYKLEEPMFPIMHKEYRNPLFLKMTCKLLLRENISEFSLYGRNIGEIFVNFIKNINKELAKKSRLNYDAEINIVQEVLDGLLNLMHQTEYQLISYTDAHKIASSAASQNNLQSPNLFLKELINEGLLAQTETYEKKQKIYFCYERLSDYYMAVYLYEQYFKFIKSSEDISKHIQLSKYFADEHALNFNSGLISALSIILPEKNCGELFEFIKVNQENSTIIEGFLDSLIWRLPASINNTTKDYIKKKVLLNKVMTCSFYRKQIQLSCYPNHPLNSQWLYEFLNSYSMANRDVIWTAIIVGDYDNFYAQYIKWVNEKGDSISEEVSFLAIMQLGWLLTLNDRTLRDTATKSIIRLLIKYPNNIMPYFNKMKSIDDPYVLERIYAILLGVVVKIELIDIGEELARSIYETIFNVEKVYPHILLRDYAKQTIRYIETKVGNLKNYIDENKIEPPYNSDWYDFEVSNEAIDNLSDFYGKEGEIAERAFSAIVSSMTTEYGRGVGGYGDFGRYTFGSRLRDWHNQFHDQDLSNIAIKRILESGYSPVEHGKCDYNICGYDRHRNEIERIGKKYQWVVFYEILAKLTDNFPTYDEEIVYDEEYNEYKEKRPSLFTTILQAESLNEIVATPLEEEDSVVMNANDHILSKEKNFHKKYKGTWDLYIRDIDPTLLNGTPKQRYTFFDFNCPQEPNSEWVKDNSLFDQTADFLEIKYEGEKYICLYSYVRKECNTEKVFRDRTSFVMLAGAFFTCREQKEEMLIRRQKIDGNGVPNPIMNGLFLHELFWSDGFKEWKNSCEQDDNGTIIATYNYSWEVTNDNSSEDSSVSLNVPCEELVKYFKLVFTGDNIWKNAKGELISFDGSLLGYENCLLFRKEEVIEFLEDNNYDLYWGTYAEKISNRTWHEWWYTTEYSNGIYEKHISKKQDGVYDNFLLK